MNADTRIEDASRILVLDPIHGAEVIAAELDELGKDVDVFNPYRESDFRGDLNYDLVIAPVHLNPNFEIMRRVSGIPVMSHHEAVKGIVRLNNLFSDLKVVEVTGTTRKTTTCELIYQLLRDKSVLLHVSSGTRYYNGEEVVKLPRLRGSNTPANILKVMRSVKEMGLNPAIAVFEVSLGFTGSGDVGVMTSLDADYMVAGGTKRASEVKIASIKNYDDGGIIVHPGILSVRGNTYGSRDANLRIEHEIAVFERLRTITGAIISGNLTFAPFRWRIGTDYYSNCLEAALCAVLSLGIAPEELNTTDFRAVDGRMNVKELKGRVLIDNSGSGTKLRFLDTIVDAARELSDQQRHMILIAGEDSPYVCEGVELKELKQTVAKRRGLFKEIIIVGNRFDLPGVVFASNIEDAIEEAIARSDEGDVIISYVKTLR